MRSTFPVTHKVLPTSIVLTEAAGTQPTIDVVGRTEALGVAVDDTVGVKVGRGVGVMDEI